MENESNKKQIIRFLKDDLFIKWVLLPTDELAAYWTNYLKRNPDEEENFHLAEDHFRNIKISSYTLSQEKKEVAFQKINQSILKHKRKQKFKTLTSLAAACIVIIAILFVYTLNNHNKSKTNNNNRTEYIVGNELMTEDIQLITENKTASFQENIDLEINNQGITQIKRKEERSEDVLIDKSKTNKLLIPYGKRSTLTLADGSKIWLNSGSILEFPTSFSNKSRDIYLTSGEIYIEVAESKDKPFYVHTSNFDVKVYGTSFNLTTYKDSPASVTLVEGVVSLKSTNFEELFLKPNEHAVYSAENNSFKTNNVNVNHYTSWRRGYLEFENTPIPDVLKLIERYYNVAFDYKQAVNLQKSTCIGKIYLSENLDNVMATIGVLSSTKYVKDKNLIYITNSTKNTENE